MKKYFLAFSILGSLLASQAQAQNFTNFENGVGTLTRYINLLIPLIIGLAVFLFIFGLLKYVTAGGDEDKIKEARNFIIFGVIGIAVMISVWGLVNIVVTIFFPDTGVFIPQIRS